MAVLLIKSHVLAIVLDIADFISTIVIGQTILRITRIDKVGKAFEKLSYWFG